MQIVAGRGIGIIEYATLTTVTLVLTSATLAQTWVSLTIKGTSVFWNGEKTGVSNTGC
jgi:hypothetical protein